MVLQYAVRLDRCMKPRRAAALARLRQSAFVLGPFLLTLAALSLAGLDSSNEFPVWSHRVQTLVMVGLPVLLIWHCAILAPRFDAGLLAYGVGNLILYLWIVAAMTGS